MERSESHSEELLRRAEEAQVRAETMGNPIEMSLEERSARAHLLANAEFFRLQARRSRRI
ncbi:MAG: hypothetical protein R3F60_25850 [bacterium]|nr:hypothetical protein [Myxococcales bacterium]MCB9549510.1 hypothetical protein [Myxococcales bacterium]